MSGEVISDIVGVSTMSNTVRIRGGVNVHNSDSEHPFIHIHRPRCEHV